MMGPPLLTLLLLVALVRGQIEVRVTAGSSRADSSVDVSGSVVDVIRDHERDAFQLSDATLKDAIEKLHGARPDDVFLKSPTPWGDLYRTYGWEEVTRTIRPTGASILGISTETRLVNTYHSVTNNGSTYFNFTLHNIKDSRRNLLSNKWQKDGELVTEKEIDYVVFFKDLKGDGNKTITHKASYGEEVYWKPLDIMVGSEDAVKIYIPPHQHLRAKPTAVRNVMRVTVEYEIFLTGSVAVNYAAPHLGHHFHKINIGDIVFNDGESRKLNSSDELEIAYYTDCYVDVEDLKTKIVVFKIPLSVYTLQ